jgi:hypothetical protein
VLRVVTGERTDEPGGLLTGLPVWPAVPELDLPEPFPVLSNVVPDDCPLTTQEIEVPAESPPAWRETSARTGPDTYTHDLSAARAKVRQP